MQIDGRGSNSVQATENASMYDAGINRLNTRCAMILNHTIIREPGAATGLSKRITILASVNGTSRTRQAETVSSPSRQR
jgi:hypothetical protein